MVEENLKKVKNRISSTCKRVERNIEEIILVCVTKRVGAERIKELIDCGVGDIGENYVQDALGKYNQLKKLGLENRINWHMVGHLQKNKAKYAIRLFKLIHSVDSLDLAVELDRCAQRVDKAIDILIQVNTSGETSKFGVSSEELKDLVARASDLTNLRVKGLMTIAPFNDDPQASRPFFRKLRLLKEEINKSLPVANHDPLTVLSMGMTQDFEVAIEEGANMLRIGRDILSNEVLRSGEGLH